MKTKSLLEMLSEKHTDWIKMVRSFSNNNKTNDENMTEDIVQDMYIRLYDLVKDPDKIMYNDEINTMYIYVTLKNIYLSYIKQNSKNFKSPIIEIDTDEEIDFEYMFNASNEPAETNLLNIEYEIEKTILEEKIREEIESWNHYNAKLFKIIYYDGVSMRQLERDTHIKLSSIFNTINRCRLKLKDKFEIEYNNLNNLKQDEE